MKSKISCLMGILGISCVIFSTSAIGKPGGQGKPDHAGPPAHAGPPDHAGPKSAGASCDAPASKGSGKSPEKVLIAHCGCNEDGTDLVWKHISVSTNAIGHLGHKRYDDLEPKPTGCEAIDTEGTAVEILHKRAADDCRLVVDGNDENIGSGVGLADCPLEPEPAIGESCSIDGPQEIPLPEEEEEETEV